MTLSLDTVSDANAEVYPPNLVPCCPDFCIFLAYAAFFVPLKHMLTVGRVGRIVWAGLREIFWQHCVPLSLDTVKHPCLINRNYRIINNLDDVELLICGTIQKI